MRSRRPSSRVAALLAGLGASVGIVCTAAAQPINITNIIPRANSAETRNQTEPNLAVDPANPNTIFATSFNDPGGGSNAPVFRTTTGGGAGNWSIPQTLPSADWTINFSPVGNICYMTRLSGGATVDRSIGGANFVNMTTLSGISDQPHVIVGRRGGQDAVFISGNSSTGRVHSSLNGGTTWSAAPFVLETTAPAANNGPPIYNAFASTGRNYAAFTRLANTTTGGNDSTGSLVIRRDDNAGAPTYAGLPAAGVQPPTMTNIRMPYLTTLSGSGSGAGSTSGQRARSSLALAVDPNNQDHVAVSFPDAVNGTLHLHVIMSSDGGNTWAEPFTPITGGAIPSLAFAANGAVGLMYQGWDGTNQSTHFRQSSNSFATFSDTTLSSWLGSTISQTHPYTGDYFDLEAVGNTFHGIFVGNNNPASPIWATPGFNVAFDRVVSGPLGVAGTTLLSAVGGTVVGVSEDPFYFNVTAVPGPGALSVLVLSGGLIARRRRRR